MANILEDAQTYVADKLNGDSQLSGLCTFLVENRKDIDYEIKNALGRQGIVGVVMTPKATYQGKYEDLFLAWQLDEFEIDIVENPTVNRGKKSGFITGQDAAMRLFDVLCPLAGENEGQLNPVSYEEGEDNGLLVNKCLLKALVFGEHGDVPQPDKPLTYQFVKLLDQAPPLSVQPHDGWMWETDNGFVLYKDHVAHQLGVSFSDMSSYVQSQISSKVDISAIHQDYIIDDDGNSISANLDVITHKDGEPYWNLVFNRSSYHLEGTKDYSWYEPTSSQHIDGDFKGSLSWSSSDQRWTLHYMTYNAGTGEWDEQEDLYDTTSGHDTLSLEFSTVSFDSCIWTTPAVPVNEHLATQEWVQSKLSVVSSNIDDQISTMSSSIESQISTVSSNIESQISTVSSNIESQISTVSSNIDDQISTMSSSIESQISTVSSYVQIEISSKADISSIHGDYIEDIYQNRINADRTVNIGNQRWIINNSLMMSGTKTNSIYIGSEKVTLVFDNGTWTYTLYQLQSDEWTIVNSESISGSEEDEVLHFWEISVRCDWKTYLTYDKLVLESQIPVRVSQLSNDSGFVTSSYVSENFSTVQETSVKRDLSDMNVYLDPLSDENAGFTVYYAYASSPDQQIGTFTLVKKTQEPLLWEWGTPGQTSFTIQYTVGSYYVHYNDFQDGGGNYHSGLFTLDLQSPKWTAEASDEWFYFKIVASTTQLATQEWVLAQLSALQARVAELESRL